MLLRYLVTRDSSTPDRDLSFRIRGAEVSRLEGFSDAVFGFAITLLVISAKAPDTSTELLSMSHAVLPFVASFAVLFGLWRAQFNFFRRYGLEDRRTITLTGVLLMIVLLAVYPLRFLCTVMLDAVPAALLAGNDSMHRVILLGDLPKVLLLYAIGFLGVSLVFWRLYAHAATQHGAIGLSELELFDTRVIQRRWLGSAIGAGALVLWCVALLSLGVHTARRDSTWALVYELGLPLVVLTNVAQRVTLRRLARERALLTGEAGAATAPSRLA